MARHLFEASVHPKIKPGELYAGYFSNVLDDDSSLDAVGLFKAETKLLFAELVPGDEDLDWQLKEGVALWKVDKGCLILNWGEEAEIRLLCYVLTRVGRHRQY